MASNTFKLPWTTPEKSDITCEECCGYRPCPGASISFEGSSLEVKKCGTMLNGVLYLDVKFKSRQLEMGERKIDPKTCKSTSRYYYSLEAGCYEVTNTTYPGSYTDANGMSCTGSGFTSETTSEDCKATRIGKITYTRSKAGWLPLTGDYCPGVCGIGTCGNLVGGYTTKTPGPAYGTEKTVPTTYSNEYTTELLISILKDSMPPFSKVESGIAAYNMSKDKSRVSKTDIRYKLNYEFVKGIKSVKLDWNEFYSAGQVIPRTTTIINDESYIIQQSAWYEIRLSENGFAYTSGVTATCTYEN
jgi:hypothetical protein